MTDTINTLILPQQGAYVNFSLDPEDSVYSYTVGGDVFTSTIKTIPLNEEITFTPEAQFAEGIFPVEYRWDFGDGVVGYGEAIVHTFKVRSPHIRVTLQVTDNYGKRYHVARQIYFTP